MRGARWLRPPALALLALGLAACGGPATDPAAEEAAIRALLDTESRLSVAGELDSLLALYVQDEKQARLSVTKSVSAMITGWEALRGHQETLLQGSWMDWEDKEFAKENCWIKVHGDDAWAVCDNVWRWREGERRKEFQNIQITIFEKREGRWLISFQAFLRDPEHLEIVDLPN